MGDSDPAFINPEGHAQSEAHQWLNNFWPKTMNEVKAVKNVSLVCSDNTIENLCAYGCVFCTENSFVKIL